MSLNALYPLMHYFIIMSQNLSQRLYLCIPIIYSTVQLSYQPLKFSYPMLLLFNLLCEVIHVLFTHLICYLSLVALPTFTNTTDAVHTCQCLILLTYKGIVQFFKTDLAHVLFYCWFFSLKCEVRPYRAPVKLIYITLELFGLVIGSRRDRQFLLGECSDFLGLVFGSAAVHMRLLIRLQGLGREGFISVVQPDIGLGFEHISISIILIIPIEQKLIFQYYKRMNFDQQIQQLLRKQNNKPQKDKVKHKIVERQGKMEQEGENRLQRLKKYNFHEASGPTEKLSNYFCSLCGRIALISNVNLQNLPKRQEDHSLCINIKINYIKLNLQRQKIKHIRRQTGIQVQYRWKCECGIPIGYAPITYDELQQIRHDQNAKVSNEPYFYVYDDALIQKMKESKLISELITYKETILLHLKRKTKK